MTGALPELELPHFLKKALAAGHPWVYRDHVPRGFSAPSGSVVRVKAGGWSGYALWDERSPIALRVVSERQPPDAAWVAARVRAAWELRDGVRESRTSAYRWIFGEGDGLPGIVVDLYGAFAVLVTYADAVEPLVPWVVEALLATTKLHGVLRRRETVEVIQGRKPPRDLIIEEHGVRLRANLFEGQKTGLFLDQRDNRRFIGGIAAGRSVLNLFSYSGGFSLHAALGGATRVTSVDAAPAAADDARHNFELNGLDPDAHEFVVADVFEHLEHEKRRFDLVICDPPSFAKSRDQLPQALKAYERLNAAGLRVAAPGALYAAASCTSQVGPDAFRTLLAEAARRAKRRFQIVHDVGQPIDHPVFAGHMEGRYLKFVVGRALPVA